MKSRERCCLARSINISVIQLPQNNCSINRQIIHRSQAPRAQQSLTPNRQDRRHIAGQKTTAIEPTQECHAKDNKQSLSNETNEKRDKRSHKILHLLRRSTGPRNKSIENQSINKDMAQGSVTRSYYTNQRLSLSVKSKKITFLYHRRNYDLEVYLKPRATTSPNTQAFFEPKDRSLPVRCHSNLSKNLVGYLNEKKNQSLEPIYSTISISSCLKPKKYPTDRSKLDTSSIKLFSSKSKTIYSTTAKQPLRPWSRNSVTLDKLHNHLSQEASELNIHMLGL